MKCTRCHVDQGHYIGCPRGVKKTLIQRVWEGFRSGGVTKWK